MPRWAAWGRTWLQPTPYRPADGCAHYGHGQPMRVLLLADTHVPTRARELPDRVWDEVAAADLVVHAGDWVVPDLLDELEARAAALLACWGNNDGAELRRRLPEVGRAEVAGVRLA